MTTKGDSTVIHDKSDNDDGLERLPESKSVIKVKRCDKNDKS